jgi:hypothetical protein
MRNKDDIVVIQVQDRRISIPKLDLKVISELGEPYKHNLPANVIDESSIISESIVPDSSKTLA